MSGSVKTFWCIRIYPCMMDSGSASWRIVLDTICFMLNRLIAKLTGTKHSNEW